MKEHDFSITAENFGGNMVLHRPDCEFVKIWRRAGKPICTMLGCAKIPEIERCECLEQLELD